MKKFNLPLLMAFMSLLAAQALLAQDINIINNAPANTYFQYLGVHCAGLDPIELEILRLEPCETLLTEVGVTPYGAFPNRAVIPHLDEHINYTLTCNVIDPQSGTDEPEVEASLWVEPPTKPKLEAVLWAEPATQEQIEEQIAEAQKAKELLKEKLMAYQEIVKEEDERRANEQGETPANPDREGCPEFEVASGDRKLPPPTSPGNDWGQNFKAQTATYLRVARLEDDKSRAAATCQVEMCFNHPGCSTGATDPGNGSIGVNDTIQIPSPCQCVGHPDSITRNLLQTLYSMHMNDENTKLRFFQVTFKGANNYKVSLNPNFDGQVVVFKFLDPDVASDYTKLEDVSFTASDPDHSFILKDLKPCATLRMIIGYHPCDIVDLDLKIEEYTP